jgi:hypothetical protein
MKKMVLCDGKTYNVWDGLKEVYFDKPEGMESGNLDRELLSTITAKVNNIGECRVMGWFKEDGWVGIIALPLNPTEWYVRQNGENNVCGLFGAEIKD